MGRRAMRVAVVSALIVLAGVAALDDAPANALLSTEIASLRSAQDTVKKAQSDLDNIDQNEADAAAMGTTEMLREEAEAKQHHPDLGEALMQEDDATVSAGLDTDAAVQVEATQQAVQQENESEGEEKADTKDVKRVFD